MRSVRYERLVTAYHGCDERVRDRVLAGRAELTTSENDYDWLGKGIYFWEFGPERALEWAEEQRRRKIIERPAILGALLYLGNCFDLLDVRFTRLLGSVWPDYVKSMEMAGGLLPENRPLKNGDTDILLRRADCAMINWTLQEYEESSDTTFHTVRGLFQEGVPAFPGSLIKQKSHIQIAVRDRACVLGYFLPT